MIVKVFLVFLLTVCFAIANNVKQDVNPHPIIELTDEDWDQIQKGQWLVGFFDEETKESKQLEEYWLSYAVRCKELNINVGRIFAPHNPGLYVRFLVTVFPKVFYIKNGVAHEVPKVNIDALGKRIENQEWNKLKPVGFLSNPFSVQMSLLSHLFVHAVNLYNFEDAILQKFIAPENIFHKSATDIVFALTFIIVGTFLGLLMTCVFGIIQIFLLDSKESEEADDKKDSGDQEEEKKEKESSEKSSDVRKRK